jgi:hypothetical protein
VDYCSTTAGASLVAHHSPESSKIVAWAIPFVWSGTLPVLFGGSSTLRKTPVLKNFTSKCVIQALNGDRHFHVPVSPRLINSAVESPKAYVAQIKAATKVAMVKSAG